MKKLTILLFSILISFNSYGGTSDKTVCVETDAQIRMCEYENGQIESKGKVKDGKKDGKWTWWYENGQIKSEEHYKDGRRDGKWTHWHKNGRIEIERNYKDGKCISGDCL